MRRAGRVERAQLTEKWMKLNFQCSIESNSIEVYPIFPSLRIPFHSGSVHIPVLAICPGKNRQVQNLIIEGQRKARNLS